MGQIGQRVKYDSFAIIVLVTIAVLFVINSLIFRQSTEAIEPVVNSVDAISPSQGPSSGGTRVTLTGTDFIGSAGMDKISSGWGEHACGIYLWQVYCWGNNSYGQLGNGTYDSSLVPVAVDTNGVLAGKTMVDVSVGADYSCALDVVGMAYCWGNNALGQLGIDDDQVTNSLTPLVIDFSNALAGKTILQITSGSDYNCVIASDNLAYCWGADSRGALGIGSSSVGHSFAPVAVDASGVLFGKQIQQISAGFWHACAVDTDGKAYCWGNDVSYQLGSGAPTGVSFSPVAVDMSGELLGKSVKQIASSQDHTCAIDTEGKAFCWGNNLNGELGDGLQTGFMPSPVAVDMSGELLGETIESIYTGGVYGYGYSCAITTSEQLYCWGANIQGELGIGSFQLSLEPVLVDTFGPELSTNTIKLLSTNRSTVCAIGTNGETYCWGDNSAGKFGNGNTNSSTVPVMIDMSDMPKDIVTKVYLGGNLCTNLIVHSSTCISCTAPMHAKGMVDVAIMTLGGKKFSISGGYYYYEDNNGHMILGVPNTGKSI